MQFNDQPAYPDARPRASYTMIGLTQSLCPECLEVVPAKIVTKGRRVYFRKQCPVHGLREDFVCSDVRWWDRMEGHTASVLPQLRSTASTSRGCPYDCGLCPEHEQHTCIGLVELTDGCNLTCPMCFASSQPGQAHHSLAEICASLDRLVAAEGRVEVCQLSGGEPTLHPEFNRIVDEALARPIDYVMINTNGIRLAKDEELVSFLAERRSRVEVYLQFDGLDPAHTEKLRGVDLVDTKRRALERLCAADVNVTLVATLVAPQPSETYQQILSTALEYRNVTGISLQPATYSGRHLQPEQLDNRVTFPDCIAGLVKASQGMIRDDDFSPLPCAHPNCHQILLAARDGEKIVPLTRFASALGNLDLLAGGISFTRERSQQLIEAFLSRASHCGSDCGCGPNATSSATTSDSQLVSLGAGSSATMSKQQEVTLQTSSDQELLNAFFAKVLGQQASAQDLLRITITSFLDVYNFDVRQAMKCCTHHVLPSGHIVPFCTYNTLYRPGHLKLPELTSEAKQHSVPSVRT